MLVFHLYFLLSLVLVDASILWVALTSTAALSPNLLLLFLLVLFLAYLAGIDNEKVLMLCFLTISFMSLLEAHTSSTLTLVALMALTVLYILMAASSLQAALLLVLWSGLVTVPLMLAYWSTGNLPSMVLLYSTLALISGSLLVYMVTLDSHGPHMTMALVTLLKSVLLMTVILISPAASLPAPTTLVLMAVLLPALVQGPPMFSLMMVSAASILALANVMLSTGLQLDFLSYMAYYLSLTGMVILIWTSSSSLIESQSHVFLLLSWSGMPYLPHGILKLASLMMLSLSGAPAYLILTSVLIACVSKIVLVYMFGPLVSSLWIPSFLLFGGYRGFRDQLCCLTSMKSPLVPVHSVILVLLALKC